MRVSNDISSLVRVSKTQTVQLDANMCHLENQNISANQKMPRVLEKKS